MKPPLRLAWLLLLLAAACNRPQKRCMHHNNGHQFCIEWRGYSADELRSMSCGGGEMVAARECPRERALGYCLVKDGKHENHDFYYDGPFDPSWCASPDVWVPLR